MRTRRTSLEVYGRIKAEGVLSTQRLAIYGVLFEQGPMTISECFAVLAKEQPSFNWNTRSRFTELRDQGAIEELGERSCGVTEENVIEWDVTDTMPTKRAIPVKYAKKPSKRKEMPLALDALRRIVELERDFIKQTRAHIEAGGTSGGEGVLWVLERVAFTDDEHAALVKLGKWLAKVRIGETEPGTVEA